MGSDRQQKGRTSTGPVFPYRSSELDLSLHLSLPAINQQPVLTLFLPSPVLMLSPRFLVLALALFFSPWSASAIFVSGQSRSSSFERTQLRSRNRGGSPSSILTFFCFVDPYYRISSVPLRVHLLFAYIAGEFVSAKEESKREARGKDEG